MVAPAEVRVPTCGKGSIRLCREHPETVFTFLAAPTDGKCPKCQAPLICDHMNFEEPCD